MFPIFALSILPCNHEGNKVIHQKMSIDLLIDKIRFLGVKMK